MDKAWIVYENDIKTIIKKHKNLTPYCKVIVSYKNKTLYN